MNFPTIRNSTRVTDTLVSLLDNIFTNCIKKMIAAIINSDVSDHFPVAVRIEVGITKNKLPNLTTAHSFDSVAF